jgi:hypothetical protein
VVGDDRAAPAGFAESLGVTVLPVQWAGEGIRTW